MMETVNQTAIHLPYKHDPNNLNGIHMFFRVFHEVVYRKNSKMRFLLHVIMEK